MKSIILFIKGFFMGIANIIPGVSGGTIAIILGIYEDLIKAISHFFTRIIRNIKLLVPIGLGALVAIVVMSNVIGYSYDNFPVPTMMFFVGLVFGGIPMLMKNVVKTKETKQISSYIIFSLTFLLVIFMAVSSLFLGEKMVDLSTIPFFGYVILFLVGVVAAATMIIPGVSGSLVMMLLGYYYPIVGSIRELSKFENVGHNILVLIVFGFGVLVGIVFISKIIEILFKKFKVKTFFGVLGFIFASLIAIPLSTCMEHSSLDINIANGIISMIMLMIGAVISYKLGDK